jgi:nitrogen-specific signal transduction histidine kinase
LKEGLKYMKMIMLVSENDDYREQIDHLTAHEYAIVNTYKLPQFSMIKDLSQCLVLVNTDEPEAVSWLKKAADINHDLIYIAFGSDTGEAISLTSIIDDFLVLPFESWQVKKTLDRAWEMAELRTSFQKMQMQQPSQEKTNPLAQGYPSRPWAQVLCDFSRALNSRLDRDRFLELFLDAVKELVPVGKISVLLKKDQSDRYCLAVHRGLDPLIIDQLQLAAAAGVMSWLSDRGGVLLCLSGLTDSSMAEYPAEVIQEMKLLQALVAVPLFVEGKLYGALLLGPKVTGTPFYEKELELLYTVCGNIAIALKDLALHKKLYNQKIFIESILQLMSNGVVAINDQDMIMTYNERAAEIFSTDQHTMIGQDLRVLPSPLGDMLYETLLTGKSYNKDEVEMQPAKKPLEVSTYRMVNDVDDIIGSVMIIDDISSRKQLELERRQSDQLEILHHFVSQLTHEVKNPMVAIQTFAQLLPEKYNDSSFRDFFSQTVKQEIKRLNELVDQLLAFSSPLLYRQEKVTIREIITSAIKLLQEQGIDQTITIAEEAVINDLEVKADKLCLSRAFSYLLKYFIEASEPSDKLSINGVCEKNSGSVDRIQITITDSKTKIKEEDLKIMFNPIYLRPESTISLGLSVSRKVIEEHGGLLKAEQHNGGHLIFSVNLPLTV